MTRLTAQLDLRVDRRVTSGKGLDSAAIHFPEAAKALPYRFSIRVQKYARMKAPVLTGYLKSSIGRTKVGENAHRVSVGAKYGVYVNYGTRYMRAQPFWEPAIRQARMDLRRDLKGLLHG